MNLLSVKTLPLKTLAVKAHVAKKLLLAGAGHAHIGLLRRLSTERSEMLKNLDIGLIGEQPQTVYSGMLPG